jgi:hypothetical protein
MVLAVVLVCHFLMSMAVLSIPYMTRREMLFGVVLPADFRQRPEGRRAIRAFQMTVVLAAVAGVLIIVLLSSRWTVWRRDGPFNPAADRVAQCDLRCCNPGQRCVSDQGQSKFVRSAGSYARRMLEGRSPLLQP